MPKDQAAVSLGRKGGLANKGIPKPASAANGSKGGRPKGSKNKPKALSEPAQVTERSDLTYEPAD